MLVTCELRLVVKWSRMTHDFAHSLNDTASCMHVKVQQNRDSKMGQE